MKSCKVELNDGKAEIKEGMSLFFPSHGCGKIESIDTKTILGETISMCQASFDNDFYQMKIFIPVSKMKEMGIRKIMSKEDANKLLNTTLLKHTHGVKGMWAKRAQEYEARIYSGNVTYIASVAKDLFLSSRDVDKPYGEKILYKKALGLLVEEVSLSLDISKEEANKLITDALLKASSMSIKNINKNVDFDKDIDEDFKDDDFDYDDDQVDEDNIKKRKTA